MRGYRSLVMRWEYVGKSGINQRGRGTNANRPKMVLEGVSKMPQDNWCKEHKTVWFKKGKMKNFAHPILDDDGTDTGKWCNKPEEQEDRPAPGSKGKSDPAERASIESQAAAKIGGELLAAKIIDDKHPLGRKTINWCLIKLGGESLAPVKEFVQSETVTATTPIVERPAGMPEVKTGAQLAAYAGKHDINTARFRELIGGNPNDLKTEAQLITAWYKLFPGGKP